MSNTNKNEIDYQEFFDRFPPEKTLNHEQWWNYSTTDELSRKDLSKWAWDVAKINSDKEHILIKLKFDKMKKLILFTELEKYGITNNETKREQWKEFTEAFPDEVLDG